MVRGTNTGKPPQGAGQDASRKSVAHLPPRVPERLQVGFGDFIGVVETARLKKTGDSKKHRFALFPTGGFQAHPLRREQKWDRVVFVPQSGGDREKQGRIRAMEAARGKKGGVLVAKPETGGAVDHHAGVGGGH